jgi:isoquinoline 1-oxidoreductase beta subunit
MTSTATGGMDRREFLRVSAVAGAGLLVGCRVSESEAARASGELAAWIHVAPDGQVTLYISESEMGQGIHTALSQVLADELEADWSTVRAVHALADEARYGRQSTGGSTSVRMGYSSLRQAGAAAREMLVAAAAAAWSVPARECRAELGLVHHETSGRTLSYGELADRASALPAPKDPTLKAADAFRYIGKPVKRLDSADKVTGRAQFGLDVRMPDLLVAVVARPPVVGGTVRSFDAAAARAVAGVREVVQIPGGVAVVADGFWAARQGRDALKVDWDDRGNAALSSERIRSHLVDICGRGVEARSDGDAAAALARAARRIDAVYEAPYLAHAAMEPMNCTAHVRADGCEIWVPTQAPTATQQTAARITGLRPDQVVVHTTYLGGGFGRRSQTDFVAHAVHVAKAVGRPVKLVYTREDDTRAGYYRPVAYNELSAGLDARGRPVAWVHRIASASITEQFGPLRDGIDASAVEGAANIPYDIGNVLVTWAKPDLPITTWWWRSVGSSQNAWVTECFLDELAHAAGKDPLAYRLELLDDHPRHRRVLEAAARQAGWGSPLPAGRARGLAVHEAFGSFVAQVAEISINGDGTVRVHRVVCAVDCGQVINPDTIAAQMDSGIIYGLSAALYGEITLANGGVVQSNFHDYPVVRFGEAPVIETHIVGTGEAHGGIGEPGTPPIAPAVCNAVLALTGKPVRKLPIGKIS